MSLFNHFRTITTIPILLTLGFPIVLFAITTSILAFSILLLRVLLIYIELFLAIIPHYILSSLSPPSPARTRSFLEKNNSPVHRHRRRRGSSVTSLSLMSAGGSFTSLSGSGGDSGVVIPKGKGLSQSTTFLPRDFEGVGGWNFSRTAEEDDDQWTNINSRLELPADHVRRHQRSLTGGSVGLEMRTGKREREEGMNIGKARTPTKGTKGVGESGEGEGYFGASSKTVRNSSTNTGSSGSSKSEVLGFKQR